LENFFQVSKDVNPFIFRGKINGKHCNFKLDTGSDVTVINPRLIDASRKHIPMGNKRLRYPTGERVPVKFRSQVEIELGEYSCKMIVYVAEIGENCILGADFCLQTGIDEVFKSVILKSSQEKKSEHFLCCQISSSKGISDRCRELFERDSREMNVSQKEIFAELLEEFEDVFSEQIVAGNCDIMKHEIKLSDSRPIKQAPRRIPIGKRAEVDEIIREMRCQGVIEESFSPWVSPAVLVRKKDGTLRFCIDYRKLNAVTIKDSYPLPRIDDLLDQLSGNAWFTTLDLKSGYWQIKIRSEDKEKTAFSVGNGLWQFTVMPFGLCNAPATFERLMERILQGLITKICLVYLDDVIVFGKTFEEMVENLKQIFIRFREANLRINPKKCSLFGRQVKYLGHIITANGISTDPEKTNAVVEWPIPQSKKQVRSFLGFCSYYRKFVKDFSIIAKPLFVLTENQVKFLWTEHCQQAFDKLKQTLIAAPLLSFPSEEGRFILDTDASAHGIGAVLSQEQEGTEKVIAYFSCVLSKVERNYCVTRRELLAMVKSIKHFHHYLYGRRFLIRTDHASLRWLMSFKDLEGQLARWSERLQQYDFEVCHRKGRMHGNADGLSRRPCLETKCKYCSRVEVQIAQDSLRKEGTVGRLILGGDSTGEWRRKQLEDPVVSIFLKGKEQNYRPNWEEVAEKGISSKIYWTHWDTLVAQNGVLYKKWEAPNLKSYIMQLVVPQKCIKQILEEAHDTPSGGHFGVNKTLEKIRRRFYWATCKKDVENWCKSCKECVAKRGPPDKGKSPMQIYNVGTPFERLQMDILGPFPSSVSGNRYLLVIVDCFTKWVEAFPLKNARALTIAEVFVNQVVSRHGVPLEIHTDQGRNFESRLFQELTWMLGIKKTRTTALHPQSDGQVERQHQTILQYLSKFIEENQRDWDRWIPMFLLAYRSSKHETTQVTPAELYFGRDLNLPLDLLRGSPYNENSVDLEDYVQNLRGKLDKIHQEVRNRMKIKSSRIKGRYDRKARNCSFEQGQKVWLYNPRRKEGKTPKLQRDWEGPYVVVRKLNDVVYCIRRSNRHKNKIVHSDRLAFFYERGE